MSRILIWRSFLIPIALLTCVGAGWGYTVAQSSSLTELTEEADIIFKGTAVGSAPVEDEWFKPYPGFGAHETEFNVITVIKGEETKKQLKFRHYDNVPEPVGRMFMPQNYHFIPGRSYIVFAAETGTEGVFRQLWVNHKSKEDQGVVLCPDDRPLGTTSIGDALWDELTTMLKSASAEDTTYAIRQLDQMSGGGFSYGSLSDFAREDVSEAMLGPMHSGHAEVAQAAIRVIGTKNPHMSEEGALYWLATVGSAKPPGIGSMDPNQENIGGKRYWPELAALADSDAPGETRALAIRALGLVREPSLMEPIERWLGDSSPAVRAAATVLLSDYPGLRTHRRLAILAGDPAPEVRIAAACAAGFGQRTKLAETVAKLLEDEEFKVRQAAAMNLLSFSPEDESIARIFRANLENEEFKPLFLNALADAHPEDYLDALAKAVEEETAPRDFWGGRIPAFVSWGILFKHLQAQPPGAVHSGKLDRYLDAIEKVGNYSSSEPRDIYAFYLQRGLTERAKRYREMAKQAVSYDLEYYFNQVDQNPSLYVRE